MKRPPRVLIVDDARDNREVYAEYLRFHGFDVMESATGADALDGATRFDPDVVLLDLRLPDISGIEVSRQLRARHPHRPTIVALTACVFETDVSNALANGCSAFLAKPCLPEKLEKEIRKLIRAEAVA
jgi:two-component system, cell cycle response regulator DivK